MVAEDERAFGPESPVGHYWLLNCVGFRVERGRVPYGVVEGVGPGADGVDVLSVRRRGLLGRRLVLVRADRVASVHPWEDTIVLASRSPAAARRRERREQRDKPPSPPVRERAADFERRLRPHAAAAALAIAAAIRVGWSAIRRAAAFAARAAARAAAFAAARFRAYAPVVRATASSLAKTALAMAAAYAVAVRGYLREVKQALGAAIERRRAEKSAPPPSEPSMDELDERRSADWPLRRETVADAEAETEAPPSRRAG